MKKLTIEEMRRETLKLEKDMADILRRAEHLQKDVMAENVYTVQDLKRIWKNEVERVALRKTPPSRPDMVKAYEIGEAVVKELKNIFGNEALNKW